MLRINISLTSNCKWRSLFHEQAAYLVSLLACICAHLWQLCLYFCYKRRHLVSYFRVATFLEHFASHFVTFLLPYHPKMAYHKNFKLQKQVMLCCFSTWLWKKLLLQQFISLGVVFALCLWQGNASCTQEQHSDSLTACLGFTIIN